MQYTHLSRMNKKTQWISLHDKILDSIEIQDDKIKFIFSEGFDVIEENCVYHSAYGVIEFPSINRGDCNCYLVKRVATNKGLRFFGKALNIDQLSVLLENGQKIELISEVYNSNIYCLKGELLPYKKYGLNDEIVIEVLINAGIKYGWN